GDAGAVPEEEASEDVPVRLVALAGARLGRADPGARAGGGADPADPRRGVARGGARGGGRARPPRAAVPRLGRQGGAAQLRRADAAALRPRAAVHEGDPRDAEGARARPAAGAAALRRPAA